MFFVLHPCQHPVGIFSTTIMSIEMTLKNTKAKLYDGEELIWHGYAGQHDEDFPCCALCSRKAHEDGGFYYCYAHRGEFNTLTTGKRSRKAKALSIKRHNEKVKALIPVIRAGLDAKFARDDNDKLLRVLEAIGFRRSEASSSRPQPLSLDGLNITETDEELPDYNSD